MRMLRIMIAQLYCNSPIRAPGRAVLLGGRVVVRESRMHSTAQQPIFGAQLDTSVRVRDYYSIVARACIPIPGGNVQLELGFRANVKQKP